MKVDISVTRAAAMARFYREGLGATLDALEVGLFSFYSGRLPDGLALSLAPREMTGVADGVSALQLSFQVVDAAAAVARAGAAGGTVLEPASGEPGRRTAAVRDPDGNSIVFLESPPLA